MVPLGAGSRLFLVAIGPSMQLVSVGTALSGIGFSFVFTRLGPEAMPRTPSEQWGLAMGSYNALLHLTLGLGSPTLGGSAQFFGPGSVFAVAAIAAPVTVPLVLLLKDTG